MFKLFPGIYVPPPEANIRSSILELNPLFALTKSPMGRSTFSFTGIRFSIFLPIPCCVDSSIHVHGPDVKIPNYLILYCNKDIS
jgi:hypothetical protein